MNFIVYQKRLSYLLELLKKEGVHTSNQLANRFFCNEKTVRNMINTL